MPSFSFATRSTPAALLSAIVFALPFTVLPFTALQAQTPLAPPSTGLLIAYQYWPVQYVQWVGTELPYGMIELDVDASAKQPLYNVILTDRSGKRITYANTDSLVAAATAQHMEAHKAAIAFEPADTQAVGAVSTLRMTLADGAPLQWRFVQGSDVSEQGAGVTPLPDVPIPMLLYREQAAVAGEGTALQIGNAVSTAEVWSEISHPPYFIAYHGAMSLSTHRLMLGAGQQAWTITSAPAAWAVGSTWQMEGEHGEHRTLRVDKLEGKRFTISGTDRLHPDMVFTMEGNWDGSASVVDRVVYAPAVAGEKHALTVRFDPAVSTTASASTMEITAGQKTRLGSAGLQFSGTATNRTVTVQMLTPAWAKAKTMTEQTTSTPTGMSITARPGK